MPRENLHRPVQCPICGNEKSFNVIDAKISAREYVQRRDGEMKRVQRRYRQTAFQTPLALTADHYENSPREGEEVIRGN
jgi:hypothetical protein